MLVDWQGYTLLSPENDINYDLNPFFVVSEHGMCGEAQARWVRRGVKRKYK